jgi:hypothetical protein
MSDQRDIETELRDYPAIDPRNTIIALNQLPEGYCIIPASSVLKAADEIADLTKANQILQALIGNRDKDVDSLRAQLAEAQGYATRILESFVSQHFPHNPDWRPCSDLIGVLTQIDNASTIARDYKAQLASARKALEEIAANKAIDNLAVTVMQMRNVAICALTDENGK